MCFICLNYCWLYLSGQSFCKYLFHWFCCLYLIYAENNSTEMLLFSGIVSAFYILKLFISEEQSYCRLLLFFLPLEGSIKKKVFLKLPLHQEVRRNDVCRDAAIAFFSGVFGSVADNVCLKKIYRCFVICLFWCHFLSWLGFFCVWCSLLFPCPLLCIFF